MESEVESKSRICPVPPGSKMGLNWRLKPRTIFMAVGLSIILTTSLMYYLMLPPALPPPLPPTPLQLTPHAAIAIDGDANFSATALLEGWPGDGSQGNPYMIDGLDIDLDGNSGSCIRIINTQVSFIISNCNLTGASGEEGWFGIDPEGGIFLGDVTNGELVNNTCNSNGMGIFLSYSSSNTVANNTCNNNGMGIFLRESNSNTVADNTCNNNSDGIHLWQSYGNTVTDNTCNNNNIIGIELDNSSSNTVANNTCNNNGDGIGLHQTNSNTVVNNTCNSNGRGISLNYNSDSNTVANNICNSNDIGVRLTYSKHNTVVNNTCNSNDIGISLEHDEAFAIPRDLDKSDYNTVVNNACNNNRIGIYLYALGSNTVENNTCLGNTLIDIADEFLLEELAHRKFVAGEFVWFLAGFGMILVASVVMFARIRRMEIDHEVVDTHAYS